MIIRFATLIGWPIAADSSLASMSTFFLQYICEFIHYGTSFGTSHGFPRWKSCFGCLDGIVNVRFTSDLNFVADEGVIVGVVDCQGFARRRRDVLLSVSQSEWWGQSWGRWLTFPLTKRLVLNDIVEVMNQLTNF